MHTRTITLTNGIIEKELGVKRSSFYKLLTKDINAAKKEYPSLTTRKWTRDTYSMSVPDFQRFFVVIKTACVLGLRHKIHKEFKGFTQEELDRREYKIEFNGMNVSIDLTSFIAYVSKYDLLRPHD